MTMLTRRTFLAASTIASTTAFAVESYPSKPIRLLVPWTAGSPADISARAVADRMTITIGQTIYTENKNGAGGTIGSADVLRQPSDGYNLYMLASAALVAPILYPNAHLDFVKQFDSVGQVDVSYSVLVVSPNSPYHTVDDLVAAIRKKPDNFSYASGGQGTPPHLAAEMLNQQAELHVTHVPYQVIGQAAIDISSGVGDFLFMGASGAIPLVRSGKLRALAVTSDERVEALSEVPTMIESGYPRFVMKPFSAILVKKGTPSSIVGKLNVELNKALGDATVKERLGNIGVIPVASTPMQFDSKLVVESERWIALAKNAKLKVQ